MSNQCSARPDRAQAEGDDNEGPLHSAEASWGRVRSWAFGELDQHGVADQAHSQALKIEGIFRTDPDGREIRIFR